MPPTRSRPLRVLGFLGLQAAFWIVLTFAFAMLVQVAGWAVWDDALTFSATNWLPWIAIAPVVFWLAQRFPFERGRILRSVPVHLVACVGCIMLAVWVSARFAPVRWPPPGTRPPPSGEARGADRTAIAREPRERMPVEIPAEHPSADRPVATDRPILTERSPVIERPATERRSGRGDWPTDRTTGMRRSWERGERGGPGRGAPTAPNSVPETLRRWAILSSLWPRSTSTLLRANFSAAVYVLIACVAHALGYYRRAQDRESQALALAAGLNRAKLDALRLQLQPHFLFNTLNAISALVHRNPRAADELIADLSELLRLSLKSADHEVPLSRELELLECYLAIEQTRLGDRLRVVRDIDPAAVGALVPTLILQPLAENAIRHGIEPRREPGTLTVSARVHGDRLKLVVIDDGLGLKGPGASSARHGIGLTNAEQRLRALHGADAQLELIAPTAGGVRVQISLPMRSTPAPAPMAMPT